MWRFPWTWGAGAQLAARASLLAVPALWLLLAALLLEPHSQSLVLWLFTKVGIAAYAAAGHEAISELTTTVSIRVVHCQQPISASRIEHLYFGRLESTSSTALVLRLDREVCQQPTINQVFTIGARLWYILRNDAKILCSTVIISSTSTIDNDCSTVSDLIFMGAGIPGTRSAQCRMQSTMCCAVVQPASQAYSLHLRLQPTRLATTCSGNRRDQINCNALGISAVQGDDVELMARLRGLLQLDVIMVLLTGLQAICAGIIGASTGRLLLSLHPVVAIRPAIFG